MVPELKGLSVIAYGINAVRVWQLTSSISASMRGINSAASSWYHHTRSQYWTFCTERVAPYPLLNTAHTVTST
eukprot:445512-Rhodomonas_salina.1